MSLAPKTVLTYPLDGANRDFQIPFEYLARKFVQVTLIGKDRTLLTLNIDYRFTQRTIITTTKAWGAGDGYERIEIRRYTSATERLVDFSDGSILRAYDLNTAQIQSLHIAEEGRDIATDTIGVDNAGNLDARARNIVNLADGTEPGDAVTVRQQTSWAESALNSSRNAKASEVAAKASEVAAKSSENASKASENAAKASAVVAEDAKFSALGSKDLAHEFSLNAKASSDSAIAAAVAADLSEHTLRYICKASPVAPTTRDDGTMLKAGDRFFSTTVNTEFIHGTLGWFANDGVGFAGQLADAAQGARLVAYRPSETVKAALDRLEKSTVTTVDLVYSYGLIQGDDANNAARIQKAFDTAPIWSVLKFPSWVIPTTVPLVLRRAMHLDFGGCTIRGDFPAGDLGSDVIRVAITDAGGNGDVRCMVINGGKIFNHMGGNCALNINPAGYGGIIPHFGLLIANGGYGGFTRCIRIGGANIAGDTNFCTIEGCDLGTIGDGAEAMVDLDGCADGHRIVGNLMYGPGSGVRVNVVEGAYQTYISHNGIVARDGALLVSNGARGMFVHNQCEQYSAPNRLPQKTMVLMQGLKYICHGWQIMNNNFGGGLNTDWNIVLYNVQGCLIDGNHFYPGANGDILFGFGGGTASPKHCTVGGNNWPRGNRPVRAAPTDTTRRLIINIQEGVDGLRGVWRRDFTISSGWTLQNFEFMKDDHNVVHLSGALDNGGVAPGTIMGAFPPGYQPLRPVCAPYVSSTGGLGSITVDVTGRLLCGVMAAAPNQRAELGHVSFSSYLTDFDFGAV